MVGLQIVELRAMSLLGEVMSQQEGLWMESQPCSAASLRKWNRHVSVAFPASMCLHVARDLEPRRRADWINMESELQDHVTHIKRLQTPTSSMAKRQRW